MENFSSSMSWEYSAKFSQSAFYSFFFNIAGTSRILILISQKKSEYKPSETFLQRVTEIRLQSTQLSQCIYQEMLSCALFGFLFLIKVSHCSINFLSEKFHCTGKDNLPWQLQETYSCYSSERNLFFFTM